VKKDSTPLKILPELAKEFPEIHFVEIDAIEEIGSFGKELIILDSADGITDVCLLTDLKKLETKSIVSMHDFDLAYTLKLMKKIGRLNSVKIFCIPTKMKKNRALKETAALIRSTLF